MEVRLRLFVIMGIVSVGFLTANAFADSSVEWKSESVEWKSDYRVGILNDKSDSVMPVKVTTFSKDALKIQWESLEIQKNEIITGYKILRKEMNSSYQVITDETNSKNLVYYDKKLPDGYYAYKIIPIIEKEESDKITMHGIDRWSNLFNIYMKGQELLAKQVWDSAEIQSELPDSYAIEFKEVSRRSNPVFQGAILDEILKARQIFIEKFDVKSNH